MTKKTEAVKKPTLKPTKKQQLSNALTKLAEGRAAALKAQKEARVEIRALCEEMFPKGSYVEFTMPAYPNKRLGVVVGYGDEGLSVESLKGREYYLSPTRCRRLVYAEEAADE